ncbi:3-phenylpropionate/trans-cinnamate dioxygenase ferredoxin reductase subunit [Nitrobacteraceae bacterium AZCC 1564]
MTGSDQHILVIGAGQAGLQAAETLRSNGFEGRISLYGDEPYAPYHRPPLSKAWLTEKIDERQLTIRDISALERKGILLRTGSVIEAIDPHARSARVSDGSLVHWSGLVLATGATPRRLPGSESSKAVHVLRSRRDATEIAERLQHCAREGRPIIIIGGGFIGLEVAASARKLGLDVTIVEAASRLLERVLSSDLSQWYADLHRSRGTKLLIGAQVSNIEPVGPDQAIVHFADGRSVQAGLVLTGIGVIPNDGLARKAGIECDNGIVVDDCCRTSVPNIVAAGDCTVRRLPDGAKIRLESVQNAVEQGRSAALALLGKEKPFTETPWFWSDQYGIKLQIAGLSHGADTWVRRGESSESGFSIFHFKQDRLIAVDSVNAVKDHMLARRVIGTSAAPTIEQVQDARFDLFTLRSKSA